MGSATLIIRHARLATMSGEQRLPGDEPLALVEDGALIASGEQIVWLGPDADLTAALHSLQTDPRSPIDAQSTIDTHSPKASENVGGNRIAETMQIDAHGMLVAPGLVDPHTHLLFAGDRSDEHAQRLAGASYLEIAAKGGGIRSTVRAVKAASDEELILSARERLCRLSAGGVTTVEVKSGYGLSVEAELRCLRLIREAGKDSGCEVIPTLLGLHAVPENVSRESWLRSVVDELTPEAARQGLARGCDAFCESGAFSQKECATALGAGLRAGLTPHLHADQLTAGGGAELAAQLNCASADHLERTSQAGAEAMARAGVVATLLPLAAWTLREKTPAQAPLFLNAGATVAIASNLNPGTQRIEGVSMLLASACLLASLTPAQALWAATRGAAKALRLDDRGQLKTGMRADLVLFECSSANHLAWHAGVEHALVVIRGGELVRDRRSEEPLRCLR